MESIEPQNIIKGSREEKQAYNKYVTMGDSRYMPSDGGTEVEVPNPIPPSSKGYDFEDQALTADTDEDVNKIQTSYKKLKIGDKVTYQGQGKWEVQFIVKSNRDYGEEKIKEIYIQRDDEEPNISNGKYGERERVTSMTGKLIVTENEMYNRKDRKPIIEKKKNIFGWGGKRKSSRKKRNRKSKRNKKSKTRRRR